jgi:hypothetical protein
MPPTLHPLPAPARDREGVEDDQQRRFRVVSWPDPVIDKLGYDPRSLYVELFWLGVLGPTSTWLMRRLAAGLDEQPQGFHLESDVMARALGLGGHSGRHAPFQRALARCVKFELATRPAPATFAVRRRMPPLSRRHLVRLPPVVQESHRRWMDAVQRGPTLDDIRKRARLLALRMTETGVDRQSVELELIRFGVHPAIAHETTVWVATASDTH